MRSIGKSLHRRPLLRLNVLRTPPHVARGLLHNGRIEATGVEIATIGDRLRGGKADLRTCPGVKGFIEEDWQLLDKILTRVQGLQLPTSLTSRRGNYSCGLDLCLSPIRLLEMEHLQTAQHKRTRP
jgi:hypothetical protein